MSSLLACPSCACHVERVETQCPHCGAPIERSAAGAAARTTGAVVLGLVVAAGAGGSMASCGDDVQSDYGAGASVAEGGGNEGGAGGAGGSGGDVQSDYGAASSE